MTTRIYSFAEERLTAIDTGSARPLRWAAWSPDGWYLLGNGGTALRYADGRFEPIATGTKHNLRGAAFSPSGENALLVGNRGVVLLLTGDAVQPLESPTKENLRRAAWHPDGSFALIVGNSGTVLRYGAATHALTPVPGDRAHTLRTIAWRPDGSYALVGAYASRYAGYPRPHALYRCDGVYLQALLTSDDEDDFVAIDWHPSGREALIAGYAYDPSTALRAGPSTPLRASSARGTFANKLLTYDGRGFSTRAVEASGALLGAAWHPSDEYALLCGEAGTLLAYRDGRIEQMDSGTEENLVGPFWNAGGSQALLICGPSERVYTV